MILLTGGTGMLGAHLALELLRNGKQIRALRRPGSSTAIAEAIFRYYGAADLFPRIAWIEGDVLDVLALQEALLGVTGVVHAAALVSFAPADRDLLWRINGEGTGNVVNAALDAGVHRFVHISSVAALGQPDGDGLTDEACWWKNAPENSRYAITKYNAEREVWRGIEEGLNAVIVNPSYVIGPGDATRSSNVVFPLAAKGIRWYSNGITGYVDARDVATATVQLFNSDIRAERFILNAENATYRRFLDLLLAAFGKPATTREVKPWMTAIAWRGARLLALLTARRPLITRETAQALHSKNNFGGTLITERLPFSYNSLEEAVANAVPFYQKNDEL